MEGGKTSTAGLVGGLARRAVAPGLLAGLAGLVAGCGGGAAAPVSAPAPVQSPLESVVPGRDREHVVGKGDTLYSIAWRYGIDYRALARANSIRDTHIIHPGQRLLVPGPDDIVAPEPAAAAASEPVGSGGTSARGAGAVEGPAVAPLPSGSPPVATELPPGTPPAAPPAPPGTEPAAQPPPATRTVAGLRWTRPASGRTISTFGRGGNKGIDIGGTFEQPVRAAAPGRVVYAGSGLIGYGKLVIVKHDSRLLSAYAHNERLRVGEGDEVKGGQHIADMGRSGKGRVMLHFEIRRDGKPVDPLRYLP